MAAAAIPGRDRVDVTLATGGPASGVTFSPDASLLAVARGHGVEIIDRVSGDTLRVLHGHTGGVLGGAFSPQGTLLATASTDRTVRLWDPARAPPGRRCSRSMKAAMRCCCPMALTSSTAIRAVPSGGP